MTAPGYDGSIKVDSSIDSKGFNAGISQMGASLKGLAVSLGLAFGVGAVVAFGKASVDAASDMAGAFIGLKSILDGQGKSFAQAKAFIQDYISDGLVPAGNAVTAYKNLAARGYTTEQIEKVLAALKNSAAFGRQASLTLGNAVQSATEGLKNENSILVDNAGVTKNVSVMWAEYAKSIGTTAAALTKEQKIQAEVAGIMNETRFQTGDAAKLANTYAGQVSALGVSFLNLKVALGNAIIPILMQIMPYIKMALDGLTVFLNQVGQVVNLFFGTNVGAADMAGTMGAVETSTTGAADAQGELAKNTEKAGKAAKGALAAFDQLNVLQKNEVTPTAASPTTPGALALTPDTGPIDEGLTALKTKVEAFKAEMLKLWEPLKLLAENIWIALKPAWDWLFLNILTPLGNFAGKALTDSIEWLIQKLRELAKWIGDNPEQFRELIKIILSVAAAWGILYFAIGAYNTVMGIMASITALGGVSALLAMAGSLGIVLLAILAVIAAIAALIYYFPQIMAAMEGWKNFFAGLSVYVETYANSIRQSILSLFDDIEKRFPQFGTTLTLIMKSILNVFIDQINLTILALVSALNSIINPLGTIKIPGWTNPLPTLVAPKIPRLATGAVIPPNSQFLAVLGDQKSGRNLEAPETLIRQIISEEIGNIKAEVTVNFAGSLAALVQELRPYIEAENVRIGGSLVNKGVMA